MSSLPPSTRWKQDVAFFLGGQTASLLGSSVVQYAIFWHLTLTTKSGSVMALATVFAFIPQAIVSIFGGAWADRLNRKILIMASDAGIAIATLALAWFLWNGHTDLWLIYAALTVRSIGAGIQTPAVASMIPQIAPQDQLLRINGLFGTVQSAMTVAAPIVAAGLYASWGLQATLLLDVVTAVIGIGLLSRIVVRKIERDPDQIDAGYFTDLREGLRYVWNHRVIRWLIGYMAVVMFLAVPPSILTPLLIARSFGDEVWRLTANELAFGIGMVIAGTLVAIFAPKFTNRLRLVALGTLALGLTTLALGLSSLFWVFIAFMALCGLTFPFLSAPMFTIFQEQVEPDRQGRVFGVMTIVMAVAMPIGMLLIGPLADRVSVESLLIVGGALTIVAGLWGMRAAKTMASHVSAPAPASEVDEMPPVIAQDD